MTSRIREVLGSQMAQAKSIKQSIEGLMGAVQDLRLSIMAATHLPELANDEAVDASEFNTATVLMELLEQDLQWRLEPPSPYA